MVGMHTKCTACTWAHFVCFPHENQNGKKWNLYFGISVNGCVCVLFFEPMNSTLYSIFHQLIAYASLSHRETIIITLLEWIEIPFSQERTIMFFFFLFYSKFGECVKQTRRETQDKKYHLFVPFSILNNIRRNIYKGNIEIKTENSNKYYSIIFFLPIAILSGLTLVVLCVCVCALFFVMFFFLSNFRRVFHLHENKFIDLAIFYVYK